MSPRRPLRVVILKPAKYAPDGYVERFRRGFMPNSTLAHMASLTPREVAGAPALSRPSTSTSTRTSATSTASTATRRGRRCSRWSASRATSFTAPSISRRWPVRGGWSTASWAGRTR
jgi:hypothetical protein